MKKLFISFFVMIWSFIMISCVSLEEVAYHDEYVVGGISYPVYYINSYPYYWFDNAWIMVPRYRYTYIRPIGTPRHIHAYRPNPHHYMHRPGSSERNNYRPGDYRGHTSHSGGPHTLQPNRNIPNRNTSNRPNANGGHRYGGRR